MRNSRQGVRTPPITFYFGDKSVLSMIEGLDPDHDWEYFGTGVATWIAQTYLRLKKRGEPVRISAKPPAEGIVILHADHLHGYLSTRSISDHCLIVCARADRDPQWYADIEIVQNDFSAFDPRCRFIPHWPQPALSPRSRDRGTQIVNIAYKGAQRECHPMFETPQWSEFVGAIGANWIKNEANWMGHSLRSYEETQWNDYTHTDLVIAIRRNVTLNYPEKPASKLVNAWLAGVPAILGPELAYQELRLSELDYVEARSLEEVMQAIRMLRANPDVYQSMVENGIRRAEAFQASKTVDRWCYVIFDDLVPFYMSLHGKLIRNMPIGLRYRYRKLRANFLPRRQWPERGFQLRNLHAE